MLTVLRAVLDENQHYTSDREAGKITLALLPSSRSKQEMQEQVGKEQNEE